MKILCWLGWHTRTRVLKGGERECLICEHFVFTRTSWHASK